VLNKSVSEKDEQYLIAMERGHAAMIQFGCSFEIIIAPTPLRAPWCGLFQHNRPKAAIGQAPNRMSNTLRLKSALGMGPDCLHAATAH
jgi:hypothetical protein